MMFSKACKVHKVVGDGRGQDRVVFDGARLLATDGRAMVMVPVNPEGSKPGMIAPEAIAAACAGSLRVDAQILVGEDGCARVPQSGQVFDAPNGDVKPPDMASVLEEVQRECAPGARSVSVVLDARLLLNLAQAMGVECVELALVPPEAEEGETPPIEGEGPRYVDRPLLVKPQARMGKRIPESGARGLIAPMAPPY